MGLSDEEFRVLTMRQFAALRKRIEHRELCQDLRFGVLAATIANSAFGREGPAASPKDFFPSLEEFGQEEEMGADEILAFIESFRASRGSTTN